MNCPNCNMRMRKVARRITNNGQEGKDYKEYDKCTYECKNDDIWVTTEVPLSEKPKDISSK